MSTNPLFNMMQKRNEKPKPEIKAFVLGFGHRARSGKDTAAFAIIQHRSKLFPANLPPQDMGDLYDIRAYSFARALKEEVNKAAEAAGGMRFLFEPMEFIQENGNPVVLPDWVTFDPNPPMDDPYCPLGKQRTLLQWWGTEFRRSINPNYWVDRTAEIIAKEQPEAALITDVRFSNELDFIRKHGAAIRVDRPGLEPLAMAHTSESALANKEDWEWDMVLKNDTTLQEFKQKAVDAFDLLYVAPEKMTDKT